MTKKFNKKALRAFAEKVKTPEIVTSLFREVESKITRVAVFDINRIGGERLLTAALFNEQGCFAVCYFRKNGEAISYGTESGKFYKEKHIEEVFYGFNKAHINTSCISDFFQSDPKEKPMNTLIRSVYSYREKVKIAKQKAKSEKNCSMFDDLSPIPSNFKSWCKRDFARIVFKTADRYRGYCQYCDAEIEVSEKLVQGRSYKCPHCRHTFIAISEHSHPWRRERGYALYGEMNGVPVIRHFLLTYFKYQKSQNRFFEYERDVLVNDDSFFYKNYLHTKIGKYDYWRDRKKYPNPYGTGDPQIYWEGEKLYPFSDFPLLSHKAQLLIKAECGNHYRWERALTSEIKNLEMAQILNAAGYSKDLAYGTYSQYEDPRNYGKHHTLHNIVAYGRTPKDILRVDGNFAKLFKDKQYGYYELSCYNSFRSKTKEGRSPQAFSRSLMFARESVSSYEKHLEALSEFHLTVAQVNKYFKVTHDSRIFDLWFDYLRHYRDAAKMSGIKLHSKSWMFPPIKDIEKKHNEAVEWFDGLYTEYLKKERERKEEAIHKFVSGLASLDNYEIDGMIAKIPHTYSDFVEEGTNNSNCVGNGWYFDRMAEAKSFVVFLRTKENKSFCTCEFIFDNGEIRLRQCRLKSNKDAPDTVHKSAQKYGKLLEKQLLLNLAAA